MRNAIAVGRLAIFALAAWPCHAAAAPTLCNTGELVVFSCPIGARTASICASANISKGGGEMQYRFGRKDRLELVYPDAGAKPADVFTSGTLVFSGGGGAWLRFDKGPFRYTIFTAIGKWGSSGCPAEAEGAVVQKDGKEFANLRCRVAAASEWARTSSKSSV
jgi:hypothetical protein